MVNLPKDVAANAATVIDDNVDAVAIEVEATEIVDGIEDEKQQADDALLVPVLAEAVPRATDSSDASEPTANPVVKKLTYAGIGVGIGSLVMVSSFSDCQHVFLFLMCGGTTLTPH